MGKKHELKQDIQPDLKDFLGELGVLSERSERVAK